MKTVKIIGSLLLIGVALVLLQRALHPKPLDAEALPPTGMGQVLAEEAVRALHDNGRVVVVCMPMGSVESRAKLESFQRAIGKHKNITITATKAFKTDEVGMMDRISFQQFAAVVNEHTNADVIVSFLGVTSFTDAQIAQLPHPSPKLIVVGWNPEDVSRGMKAGLVTAAVTPRVFRSLPTDHPKTPDEWFDRYYDLVTPESTESQQ